MTATSADRPSPTGPTLADRALLEVGFRPFFLAGAAWAILAMVLWLAALAGVVSPGGDAYGPLAWHAHEMVYGFGAGIVGGFLLTAVPSWTGQPKLAGRGLAALAGLWLLGRIVMLAPDGVGVAVAAVVDLGFLAALAARNGWQVRAARNWRNLPMVAGPLLLLAGNALVHADAGGLIADAALLGNRMGLAAIVMLAALIGGRIIPAFTRNWLVKTGRGGPLPVDPDRLDVAVLLATLATLAAWLAFPDERVTGILAGAVALGTLVRLGRWQGWRTGSEPLVWVLHVGYIWIPVGFALMAASSLDPAAVPQAAVRHAFGVGVVGTMTLAMMTRATLGHTGRALAADRATTAVYLLITATAVLRVAAVLVPSWYGPMVELSGAGWMSAFALYLAAYAPKLWGPRVGG